VRVTLSAGLDAYRFWRGKAPLDATPQQGPLPGGWYLFDNVGDGMAYVHLERGLRAQETIQHRRRRRVTTVRLSRLDREPVPHIDVACAVKAFAMAGCEVTDFGPEVEMVKQW